MNPEIKSTELEPKPTLWVVSELYYPEETSTGYYLTRIAEGLANDARVRVLCAQPTYSKRGIRAAKHETHKGVEIFRVASTTLNKNVIPFRVINMITLGIFTFFKALRHFAKGDRVLVVTTPPSTPFVIAIASLIKGSAYTLLIHDSYPELLVAVGKTRAKSIFVRTMNHANRWLYKHASKIIVVSRDMLELTEQKTTGLDIPVVNIPNWAELESVSPSPRDDNELLRDLGLLEKVVFLYAGNMGHPNDLESIIECAAKLDSKEKAHFIFLGAGAKRKWLESEISRLNLENVTLLDPRPRSEQQLFLNACDVAIVSLVTGMKGVSMPSRTYNALAAGKPLLGIVEKGSETDRIIEEEGIGWSVLPQKPEALLVTLREILQSTEKLPEMAKRARLAAVRDYSVEKAISSYRSVVLGGTREKMSKEEDRAF
jgi:colanic acid biosynthesis glycosyl transferase WcaI